MVWMASEPKTITQPYLVSMLPSRWAMEFLEVRFATSAYALRRVEG